MGIKKGKGGRVIGETKDLTKYPKQMAIAVTCQATGKGRSMASLGYCFDRFPC